MAKSIKSGDIVYNKLESWPTCKRMVVLGFNPDSSSVQVAWQKCNGDTETAWVNPATISKRPPLPFFEHVAIMAVVLVMLTGFTVAAYKASTRKPVPSKIVLPTPPAPVIHCDGTHHPKTIIVANKHSTITYDSITDTWKPADYKNDSYDYFIMSTDSGPLEIKKGP